MRLLVNLVIWGFIFWKLYRFFNKKKAPQAQVKVQQVSETPPQIQPLSVNMENTTTRVTTPMQCRDKRIAAVTKSLYNTLNSIAVKIGAFNYYLPGENEWQTAQYKRGIPYCVTFSTKTGLRCFLLENCQNSDTVRVLKEVYLLNEECVPEEQNKEEPKGETSSETSMEDISKDWWSRNWPKLEEEISLVDGRREITLSQEKYRIPSQEILPFVKKYLEDATKGSYTFDGIDEDLIGLAVPVMTE